MRDAREENATDIATLSKQLLAKSQKSGHSSRARHRHENSLEPSARGQAVLSPSHLSHELERCEAIKVVSEPERTRVVVRNEEVMEEREKLIRFIRLYAKKNGEIPPTTLDYYKFLKLIGKGAFGKVTLGVHKLTGKQVAIKTIEKSYMKDEFSRKKVFQEVYILKKIKHSNIIRLLEVFESPKHLLMVMEYAGGGDLLQFVKKRGRLEEDEARHVFR